MELTGVDESLDGGQQPKAHYDTSQLDRAAWNTIIDHDIPIQYVWEVSK